MPRKQIVVSGRVQGVGFRYHANLLAKAYQLSGWVRNQGSEEVAMEVQGPQENIDKFLSQLGKCSLFIRIDHMDIENLDEIHESGFDIRY